MFFAVNRFDIIVTDTKRAEQVVDLLQMLDAATVSRIQYLHMRGTGWIGSASVEIHGRQHDEIASDHFVHARKRNDSLQYMVKVLAGYERMGMVVKERESVMKFGVQVKQLEVMMVEDDSEDKDAMSDTSHFDER